MQDPELDEDTLRLIVKLQLEDIKNLNVSRKGKHRAGEQPDPVVAAKVYEDELRLAEQFARDAAMCKSIAEAVREDGDAIMAFELVEQQARHDRKIAQSMQGVTDTRSNQQRTRHQSDSTENTLAHVDNELLERMLALSVDNMEGESSDWAASRKQETRQCDICTDFHAEYLLRKLHCDHTYCKNCLVHLFTDCLSDESLFPPRCCRHPIPLDDAKALLDPVLVGRFKARELELSTENRTYCHRPGCSTFVPAQFIVADRAICPNCRAATCTTCKSAAHDNTDCPKDENFQQFEQFAAQEGWQRCYSCRRFVELAHGCNHMTCRCQAEFCYECGARWKTCECDHFREDRLVARANVLVNRNPQAAHMTGQQRDRMQQREMDNLRENHECEHRRWRYVQGSHQCEECYHWLPEYIFECRQCRIQACNRCRRNRL